MNTREFLGLFVAFTLGAMCVELKNQREISDLILEVKTEHTYHTGYDEGYNDAEYLHTERTITVFEPEVIQEDDPRWDCLTMGNKICGVRSER